MEKKLEKNFRELYSASEVSAELTCLLLPNEISGDFSFNFLKIKLSKKKFQSCPRRRASDSASSISEVFYLFFRSFAERHIDGMFY